LKDKLKKCKGTHKYTYGLGCGELVPMSDRQFGIGKSCGCFKLWLQSDRSNEFLNKRIIPKAKKDVAKENKAKYREAKRELNISGAMKLADTYFSRYIRLKNSVNGFCTCYTCGRDKPIKETDNGHYMKREHKATRYHENNCRTQCKTCNGDTKHNGKQAEFRVHLSHEIGEEQVIKIESLSRSTINASSVFYRQIADEYREKVNELQKKLKVKYW